MKLWLDDDRMPPDNTWTWCRSSYEAFVELSELEKRGDTLTEISFDHDLGADDKGTYVANHIEELAYFGLMKRVKWRVHADNPWRTNIIAAMESADRYWDKNDPI